MNNRKVRIYELSKELNLDNKDIKEICEQLNIAVKSHSSTITASDAKRVINIAAKYSKVSRKINELSIELNFSEEDIVDICDQLDIVLSNTITESQADIIRRAAKKYTSSQIYSSQIKQNYDLRRIHRTGSKLVSPPSKRKQQKQKILAVYHKASYSSSSQ